MDTHKRFTDMQTDISSINNVLADSERLLDQIAQQLAENGVAPSKISKINDNADSLC